MKDTIKEMLNDVLAGKLTESKDTFKAILGSKIKDSLSEMKVEVAKTIFKEETDYSELESVCESEHSRLGKKLGLSDKDFDDDDRFKKAAPVGKEAEVDDAAFAKHPKRQLDIIASYKKVTPEENTEYTLSGKPSLHSLKAQAAKGEKDTAPFFTHTSGETSAVNPTQAQHILNHISGMKPDLKQKVFDTIHGSKEGFEKVATILAHAPAPKSSSIYTDVRA